ncbi:MAG: hypothetical protein FJX44_11225 [Alphaproteobacteria bacterium]|nr:hypothetical protein [Alphaproteobacteria bacterium]
MRVLLVSSMVLISLILSAAPAMAEAACTCQGCGCKGGPGWRGPKGYCVSAASLAKICGSPPGVPCTQENVERVCMRNAEAEPQVEIKAETP